MAKRSRVQGNITSHYINLVEAKSVITGEALNSSGAEYVIDDLQEDGNHAMVTDTKNILPTEFGLTSGFNRREVTASPKELLTHDVFTFDLRTGRRATISLSNTAATIEIPGLPAVRKQAAIELGVLADFTTEAGYNIAVTGNVDTLLTDNLSLAGLQLPDGTLLETGANAFKADTELGSPLSEYEGFVLYDPLATDANPIVAYGALTTTYLGKPVSPNPTLTIQASTAAADNISIAEARALGVDPDRPLIVRRGDGVNTEFVPRIYPSLRELSDELTGVNAGSQPYTFRGVTSVITEEYLGRASVTKLDVPKVNVTYKQLGLDEFRVIAELSVTDLPALANAFHLRTDDNIPTFYIAFDGFTTSPLVAKVYNPATNIRDDSIYRIPDDSKVITIYASNGNDSTHPTEDLRNVWLEPAVVVGIPTYTLDTSPAEPTICVKYGINSQDSIALSQGEFINTPAQAAGFNWFDLRVMGFYPIGLRADLFTPAITVVRETNAQLLPMRIGMKLSEYRRYVGYTPPLVNAKVGEYLTFSGLRIELTTQLLGGASVYNDLPDRMLAMLNLASTYRRWTKAVVNGDLYLYQQGLGHIIKIDVVTGAITEHVPTFANMPFIQGIAEAAGLLIMWDSAGAIYRSSYFDPTDFKPQLKTQATVHSVEAMLGSIIGVVGIGDDYVLYSTGSIIYATFNKGNGKFSYSTLSTQLGVFSLDSVTQLGDAGQAAFTNGGLVIIQRGGNLQKVAGKVSEYLAAAKAPIRLDYLLGRYLAVAAKVSRPSVTTYSINKSTGFKGTNYPALYSASPAVPSIPELRYIIPALDPVIITVTEQTYVPPTFGIVHHVDTFTYPVIEIVPTDGNSPDPAIPPLPDSGARPIVPNEIKYEWIYPVYSLYPVFSPNGALLNFKYKLTNIIRVPFNDIAKVFVQIQYEWIVTIMTAVVASTTTISRNVFARATAIVANIPPATDAPIGWQTNITIAGERKFYAENALYIALPWDYDTYNGTNFTSIFTQAALVGSRAEAEDASAYFRANPPTTKAEILNAPDSAPNTLKLEAIVNDETYTVTWDEVVMLTEGEFRLTERTYEIPGYPERAVIIAGVDGVPAGKAIPYPTSSGLLPKYSGGEFLGADGSAGNLPPVYDKTYILDTQTGNWGSCDIPVRLLYSQTGINSAAAAVNLIESQAVLNYAEFLKDLYALDAYGNIITFDLLGTDSFVRVGKIGAYEGYMSNLYDVTWTTAKADSLSTRVSPSLDGVYLDQQSEIKLDHKTNHVPIIRTGRWFELELSGSFVLKGLHTRVTKGGIR